MAKSTISIIDSHAFVTDHHKEGVPRHLTIAKKLGLCKWRVCLLISVKILFLQDPLCIPS